MQLVNIKNIIKDDVMFDEYYKRLRTNIIFSGANVSSIVVTSTGRGEGKTEVSFNMATALAKSGKKVMFIDADLRNSNLGRKLMVTTTAYGLSHYLTGNATLDDVVCKTDIDNFYMILSGPVSPNPVELLESERFDTMLRDIERRVFDYIIIDSTPVGAFVDPVVITKKCDGVVLVAAQGEVSYKELSAVKRQFEQVGCKILGAVFNKQDDLKNEYNKYSKDRQRKKNYEYIKQKVYKTLSAIGDKAMDIRDDYKHR